MFRRIATVFTLIAAFAAFASASSIDMSDSASLEDLLNGGSLSLGAITIDGFESVETAIAGAGSVSPVDPATVGVRADLICGNKIQLTFGDGTNGLGGFVASAANGGTYDYLVNFDISGVAGGISDASLTQLAGGAGASYANITETILYDNGGVLTGVGLNTDSLSANNLADQTTLPGSPTSISVSKDILLQSFAGSSAQISQFSQMYMIPEPSSIGLGLFALLGAVGMTRRRRR